MKLLTAGSEADTSGEGEGQALTVGMRRLLLITGALVIVLGVQLFVLTDETERYFAWTIDVPLSAAFLGAGYWASVALLWLAARERLWARARIAVPAVVVLTAAMLMATIAHLELFHLDGSAGLASRAAAYGWIAAYALVPMAMLVLSVTQVGAPGGEPPRILRLPAGLRITLGVHAVVLIVLGAALLLSPEWAGALWPWGLTPLTARAIGAWVLGTGVAAAHWMWENAWERARSVAVSYSILAVLEIVALIRYPSEVDWATPKAWVYTLFLVTMLGIGLYGATANRADRT